MIKQLLIEEEGQTLIEYALLAACIGLFSAAILTILGRKTKDIFISISEKMITTDAPPRCW